MTRVWSVVMAGLWVLAFGLSAQAATLEWDRNSEADMKDYFVLQCLGTGCTVDPLSSAVNVVPQAPIRGETLGASGDHESGGGVCREGAGSERECLGAV